MGLFNKSRRPSARKKSLAVMALIFIVIIACIVALSSLFSKDRFTPDSRTGSNESVLPTAVPTRVPAESIVGKPFSFSGISFVLPDEWSASESALAIPNGKSVLITHERYLSDSPTSPLLTIQIYPTSETVDQVAARILPHGFDKRTEVIGENTFLRFDSNRKGNSSIPVQNMPHTVEEVYLFKKNGVLYYIDAIYDSHIDPTGSVPRDINTIISSITFP